MSTISNHLSSNLTFKTNSLFEINETKSLLADLPQDSTNLKEILKQVPYLKDQGNQDFSIEIPENLKCFTILNIPQNYKKSNLLDLLNIDETKLESIHKSSMFWNILSTDNQTNSDLSKNLSNVIIDGNKIKYEEYSKDAILKNLKKKIQNAEYNREVTELKQIPNLSNSQKENSAFGNKQKEMSWRKNTQNSQASEDTGLINCNNEGLSHQGFRRSRFYSDYTYISKYIPTKQSDISAKITSNMVKYPLEGISINS